MPWLMLNDRPSFSLQRTYKQISHIDTCNLSKQSSTPNATNKENGFITIHHCFWSFVDCSSFISDLETVDSKLVALDVQGGKTPQAHSIVFKDTQIIPRISSQIVFQNFGLEKVVLGGSLHRQALLHVCLEPRPIKLEDLEHVWMLIGVMVLNPKRLGQYYAGTPDQFGWFWVLSSKKFGIWEVETEKIRAWLECCWAMNH